MDTIKWATLSQLKKGSQGRIGLGYNLLVEMAYENIRLSHKKIVKKLHSLEQENARLKEQVDHLSQYAHCSMDYKNKYAHGGASVCQSCYNDLKSKLQAYEKATEV